MLTVADGCFDRLVLIIMKRKAEASFLEAFWQGHDLTKRDERAPDGDHRLRKRDQDPRNADKCVAIKEYDDLPTIPGKDGKEANEKNVAYQEHGQTKGRRARGVEPGEPKMGATQGSESGPVICKPGEHDRRNLVIPGER